MGEDKLKDLAEEEFTNIKNNHKKIESLRKKAVELYLKEGKISDYILHLMGDDRKSDAHGKYYYYLKKKKEFQKSEHMGVGAGDYLEEMIFDFLNEIISKKYNSYVVARQKNVVGSKNKKQDIVIQKKEDNEVIIVLELKSFMGGDNCKKMLDDKKQIEEKYKNQVNYFGYAPYLYTTTKKSKRIEENENDWLFYGKIEPLLKIVFTILDNH